MPQSVAFAVELPLPLSTSTAANASWCRSVTCRRWRTGSRRPRGPGLCAPMHACARPGPSSSAASSLVAEARTVAWVRSIVIGLQLCPFAKAAMDRARVRVVVTHATTESAYRAAVETEVSLMLNVGSEKIETSLVVAPSFAADDFRRFNEFADALTAEYEDGEYYSERVMLASFHPQHMYGDAAEQDAAVNFDKRSPYSCINILRTEQVDEYIDQGLTQNILARNKETLEGVGSKKLLSLYRELM